MKITSIVLLIMILASCTKNDRAKNFGGKASITLQPNRKLVTATWKETNLWYLTRPMLKDEKADTLEFHEESSFGVWKGTYIIIEVKN